ncbi:putative phosphoenolpyruvate synthase isoform X1 [Hylaeus volcanicus]|nr:putative phosphoenolpyruvate synthase isoform X1 [Hylaeus volcanicus]
MDNILLIKIAFSILFPLLLYFWFSNEIKKPLCLDSECKISRVRFLLKRWWAERCINARKKKKTNLHNCKNNYLSSSKIKDKDSSNTILFYGTDQKGNSVFIKFSYRGFNAVEVSLQFTTSDGRLYVLPAYPNTTLINSADQKWTANGLKIEILKPQKRWRIVYNGMLRNLSQDDACNDENIQHFRLNFIFIAHSELLKWPDDWSSKLHAEALALESWKNPDWIDKINLLEYIGFDQFGSLLGQVTYEDGFVSDLYLRGLHQHRWGKNESHEFHESITLFGVMPYGAMYYLSVDNTKHSFPQIRYGQFRSNNEVTRKIDNLRLTLSDFTKEKFADNLEYKIWLTVEGKEYNVLVKCGKPINLYYGQPWNWVNKIAPVKLKLNGRAGTGLMLLCHSYNGPFQVKVPAKLQYLKPLPSHVQKNDYVVHFNDVKCQNEEIVGGKGFSLAMLTSIKDADFIVPKGFCITVLAFELQLHTHKELQKVIDDIQAVSVGKKEGDLKEYCDTAVRTIQSTPVLEEVKNAILKAIKDLESEDGNDKSYRYAIRSSAVGEDSEETSAAGQNSTYLGIQGVDNVIKKVSMCWASLFSYQSIEYRKQHGMFVKASMGVCIQKMVNADAAGVMFTRHPTTGNPSNIVITANYGLGETVVSATVEPDTIIVNKSWDEKLAVKNSIVGNKKQKMLASGDALVIVNLNDQENKSVCISEETALRLAAIGMNLETLFGSARDIEWAVMDEKIYLLQARPITTLYAWTEFELKHELDTGVPSDIDILTFANIGEVFPNPMCPLSTSTIVKTFNEVTARSNKIEGRVCFNIIALRCSCNYYNVFLANPTNEITFMNKVVDIAVSGDVIVTPEIHRIAHERNGRASFFTQYAGLYKMLNEAITNSTVEKFAKETDRNFVLNVEDFHNALSLYNEINQRFFIFYKISECHIHASRVSVLYQVIALSLLIKSYEDIGPEHFSDIAILLGSGSDIISGEVLIGLKKIGKYIKKSEKVEEFRKLDPKKVINWLEINCPLGAKEFKDLLKKHGHRCIQEMDLLSEPWSLRPENLITTLQTMVMSPEINNSKKAVNAEETVASLKTPKSPIVKLLLKKLVPFLRSAVVRREMTKSIFVNTIHKIRLAYRKLGKLMVLEEYLPNEDLIFFLTNDEIGELLSHRKATFVQKAFHRRKIFPRLMNLRYSELSTGMPIPIKNDLDNIVPDGSMKIQGTPVCGGSVLNRACVIIDLMDAQKIQNGDILITYATDIAWSPYFALLSGIVTELGGLISHGAVVAREYGLPCIISAKRATQMFQTGDMVLLNANTGVLQLVKRHDQKDL